MLLAAQSALATSDRTSAVAHLARAEAKLQAGGAEASWLWAAHLYDGASTCSGAERALAHVKGSDVSQIRDECKRLRRLVAMPAKGVATEHEYVGVVQRAQQEALLGRHTDAMRDARSLQETFPGTPGGAVIACLVDGQQKPAGEARKSCESARGAAPEAFLPRYVLGLLHCAEGHFADARTELESALALEDSTTSAWASLAAVYDQLGDGASAKALAARYRTRFRSTLRPAIWPAGWPHPAAEITSPPRR